MTAFLLSLALFTFWSVVGFAFVSLLNSRRNLLGNALLSPVVGASLTVLLVIWVNRMGLPVKFAGPAVTLLLLLAAGIIIRRVRPVLPISRLRLFLVVLLASAVLTGYPMFRYGFNWVSYCNDDMATYCMGAKLFLNHGFFHTPNWQTFIANRDTSLNYWFLEVFSGMRAGSEELIAWVASITGLTTPQVFMPTILALQFVLIAATGALVLRNRTRRTAALFVSLWTAVSALVALGTLYHLIAQVLGLSLLAGLSTLLLSPFHRESPSLLRRASLLRGILAAGLCIVYPEVLPFAVLSFLLYHVLSLARHRESFRNLARGLGSALACSLVFIGIFLPGVISTLVTQADKGMESVRGGVSLFPYYLMPSGFAYLWGFSYIGGDVNAVSMSVFILVGMLLFILCLTGILALVWQGEAAATLTLVMVALGVRLFWGQMDFGLFKIAMYVQPFLIASAVLSWNGVVGKWIAPCKPRTRLAMSMGLLVLLAALGMRAQAYYVLGSTGALGSGLIEISDASESGLLSTLKRISQSPRRAVVLTDTANVVLAKFESLYVAGSSFSSPALDQYVKVIASRPKGVFRAFLHLIKPSLEGEAVAAAERRQDTVKRVQFDMHGALPQANGFDIRDHADEVGLQDFTLLASGPRQDIVNRRIAFRESSAPDVRLVPSERVRDHLVFVESRFGTSYYSVEGRAEGLVGMYQLEKDWVFPGASMAAMGQDVLFQVLRPSKRLRIVLEYSASLNADGRNRIPPISVIGNERTPVGVEGRGSARLFSPPIEPQVVRQGQYILLDMGVRGSGFPGSRSGLMRLYGRDLLNDYRRLVGFGRDISAISEEDYQALHPPHQLKDFPAGLSNRDLEYSGIYEDGWIGESSFAVLDQPQNCWELAVSFTVPSVSGFAASSTARILLDGKEIARRSYQPGDVQFHIPVPAAGGKHRIDLLFDHILHLPSPDNRPVSALLHFIEFQGNP
jgi:hypothetical protein